MKIASQGTANESRLERGVFAKVSQLSQGSKFGGEEGVPE